IEVREELEFDDRREEVRQVRRTRYLDLVLDEHVGKPPAARAAETAEVLVAAARRSPSRALNLADSALAKLVNRLRWLGQHCPELDLPKWEESDFLELLPSVAMGRISFDDLRRAPWVDFVRGGLTSEQARLLEREAPTHVIIPSGRAVELDYPASESTSGALGRGPILAVKIQELFGMSETPRLARGRVPVLFHLLAPNRRPQQITDDLASFWKNTYPQVRKDLRGRYPKHAWPEDPTDALPERNPRRDRPSR
ncbi:MAG: ATP-dependent helicase HrpB, partial [Planctomycetes bacterium]|nr:ATP-dependent helicase HrpB [Planctomycetota bacterium]